MTARARSLPFRPALAALAVSALALLTLAASGRAGAPDDHDPPVFPLTSRPEVAAADDSIFYAAKVAKGNLVGVTITNYGFIGNNFISTDPSLEYPLGAGYEHLVRGGLWFGAKAQDQDGPFIGVVTAALDGSQGSASQAATEYTPAGRAVIGRSTLRNNSSYSKKAVSEQDLISDYSDRPAKSSDNNGQRHRPMGILVHQENYSWSFSDYAHINFFHFQIINNGPPLQDAWVGIYTELASGYKKGYSSWPPSSSGGGDLGGWYRKKWLQYDDSLNLYREHYCLAKPVPTGCILSRAPYWIGLRQLGWKRSPADTAVHKKRSLSAWGYAPGSTLRDEDIERYDLMSSGVIQPLIGDSLTPGTGDPVAIFSVGPFSEIDPGDTISADFALVGGAEIEDIQEHSRVAQRAFDRDYIVPVPPPSPALRVVPRHNALDLYWDKEPEDFRDPTSPNPDDFEGYRVYVGEDRLDLHRVAQYDRDAPPHDTTGFNTGLGDPSGTHGLFLVDTTFVGDTTRYVYRYTIDHLRDGFKYFVAVTSYDVGNNEIESLESGVTQNKSLGIPAPARGEHVGGDEVTVFPNPYRVEARWDQGQKIRDHYLWFANLPERATLKIFTLSGDLVFETDFDGASYHGNNARGIYDPRTELDILPPSLSGRMYGWNMITKGGQAAATGLYLFSVEDKAGGKKHRGKFLIVKSDRENF